jgi:hypothetical protein
MTANERAHEVVIVFSRIVSFHLNEIWLAMSMVIISSNGIYFALDPG